MLKLPFLLLFAGLLMGAAPANEPSALQKTLQRYGQSASLAAKVNKKVTNLLGDAKSFSGELVVAANKLRLDLQDASAEEKTLTVINGAEVWLVTYPPPGTKLKTQVIVSTLDKKAKASMLLTSLLGGKNNGPNSLDAQFTVTKTEKQNAQEWFWLQPKKPESEFTKVLVKISGANLAELTYWDELENSTTFEFADIRLDGKVANKLFQYAPPKDAEVTRF